MCDLYLIGDNPEAYAIVNYLERQQMTASHFLQEAQPLRLQR